MDDINGSAATTETRGDCTRHMRIEQEAEHALAGLVRVVDGRGKELYARQYLL
jgi:hypothetical protein